MSSTNPSRKRSRAVAVGSSRGGTVFEHSIASTTTTKRARVTTSAVVPTISGNQDASEEPMPAVETSSSVDLKSRFLETLARPQYASSGISNTELKAQFGSDYINLVPIINELNRESRITMSQRTMSTGGTQVLELSYKVVADDLVSKLSGLDVSARMVYQVIEKSQSNGIWTKDIRLQTNIQQQMLTKILKTLETRRLIKPVKSVTAKAKKLYMLYDLTPSKEITGGVWYSDWEFDHSFIQEMREFLLQCIRRLNGGKGTTLSEIRDKVLQSNISRVQLSVDEVGQLVRTLVYDYLVDVVEDTETGTTLYEASKRLSSLCEFQWWDAVSDDFHFRTICFEDGITLAPHEPHYHTSS